jgi:hypothetical protein
VGLIYSYVERPDDMRALIKTCTLLERIAETFRWLAIRRNTQAMLESTIKDLASWHTEYDPHYCLLESSKVAHSAFSHPILGGPRLLLAPHSISRQPAKPWNARYGAPPTRNVDVSITMILVADGGGWSSRTSRNWLQQPEYHAVWGSSTLLIESLLPCIGSQGGDDVFTRALAVASDR